MKRVYVSSAGIVSLHVPDLDALWLGVEARLAMSDGLRVVVTRSDSFAASKGRNVSLIGDGVEGAKASETEVVTSTKNTTKP